MHTLISLTKDLSVQEDRFTFPVASNPASVSTFPFDKVLKEIEPSKDNNGVQPRRHDRCHDDVRSPRKQKILLDMQKQDCLRKVGTNTDTEMRDGVVPTSPVCGQLIDQQNDSFATPPRSNQILRGKMGTAPPQHLDWMHQRKNKRIGIRVKKESGYASDMSEYGFI